jgi:hypothetical protein
MVGQKIVDLSRIDLYYTLSSDEYGKTFHDSERYLRIHFKIIHIKYAEGLRVDGRIILKLILEK